MADDSDKRAQALKSLNPNYEEITPERFVHSAEESLRTIIGAFAFKVQPEKLIPKSFADKYGDDAAAAFLMATQHEAVRRRKSELYALAALNGGIGGVVGKPVKSDVAATVTYTDGTVAHSTAPKIVNYAVAQDALTLMKTNEQARKNNNYKPQTAFDTIMPQSVVQAVAAANDLPDTIAARSFKVAVGDEAAFLSGYASRAGASNDIGPLTMQYSPSAVCSALNKTVEILNPSKPDVDAGLAWAAGYIVRDVEEMPEAQRTNALLPCADKAKRVVFGY